jgi:glycosyltransferase involved in cell wall biosynthesis
MKPPWPSGQPFIAVVISAHDAESDIEGCIRCVFAASDECGSQGTLWIVVVASGCADRTADLARRAIGPFGEVLECDAVSAGTAGAFGATAALAHFGAVPATEVCIAHTDAHTRVPRRWLRGLARAHERLTVHLHVGSQETAAALQPRP